MTPPFPVLPFHFTRPKTLRTQNTTINMLTIIHTHTDTDTHHVHLHPSFPFPWCSPNMLTSLFISESLHILFFLFVFSFHNILFSFESVVCGFFLISNLKMSQLVICNHSVNDEREVLQSKKKSGERNISLRNISASIHLFSGLSAVVFQLTGQVIIYHHKDCKDCGHLHHNLIKC